MRIGLAQMNATVGDLEGNARRILRYAEIAEKAACDLLVTPELVISGYPPQDLLLKQHFVSAQLATLRDAIIPRLPVPSLVGFADRDEQGMRYNAVAFIQDRALQSVIHKTLLPTYDVFDEWRYFRPGRNNEPITLNGTRIGVTICEDIWDEKYERRVVPELVSKGANCVINLSSSPFHAGKRRTRIELCQRHAKAHQVPVLYCNLVGAQDELIFDGESLAIDARGRLVALGPQFCESLVVVDCRAETSSVPVVNVPDFHLEREVFSAICLGIADYFRKCSFTKAVIGLSGGIDSALTACLAVEALGAGHVIGIAMPSRYTAAMSLDDAAALAGNLGIEYHVLPIDDSITLATARYTKEFGDYQRAITVENLQARERGKILMEISNDQGALVLATGNKTEYALGYSTLYGDMCGGLAAIGDVSKPEVYALARYYNTYRGRQVIPRRTIERPPSAELHDEQVDPFDYDRIGPLTGLVVEDHLSREELQRRGYTSEEIETVLKLVRVNEYKRKQAPPILRVTEKSFGIGRKMPIANQYRD